MPHYDPPHLTARRLFDTEPDSPYLFHVSLNAGDWHTYALGYKQAADAIANRLVKGHRISDAEALPALFLYRHYVELSLKSMLLDAGETLDIVDGIDGRHPLRPTWSTLRVRIGRIRSRNSEAWLDRAESLIGELDRVDSSSFAFRYPVDKKGSAMLPPDLVVDIRQIRDVMAELELILDGIAAWLDEHVSLKRDFESEGYDW